jgi:energy-coupling factor transporter ATP-binding protein EcfA2
MKIRSLRLRNFRRFTDLTITSLPDQAKLVLLVGSNGSGKSSVFDAFGWLNKRASSPALAQRFDGYYRKQAGVPPQTEIGLADGTVITKSEVQGSPSVSGGQSPALVRQFIGRSSNRIVPRITNRFSLAKVPLNTDGPATFIDHDERFINDIFLYIQAINQAVRDPFFKFKGQTVDASKVFQELVQSFNTSLRNIFGDNTQTTIQLVELQDATVDSPPKLIFQKGGSRINYDYLGHGEKQVVVLLLNFIVRQKYYRDSILFIDEMDLHLNTKLQYQTIKEIAERWIPEDSQLWTASHALGFIDFANDYEKGVVLDLDDLDFDLPQVVAPSLKNDYQVFEIAVSRDFLGRMLQGKRIFFVEQTDAHFYNNLNLENIIFVDGKDKLGAFHKAKGLELSALVDRDYLTDAEVQELQQVYPFLHFTPYYSIENLLYHPANLAEYHQAKGQAFDQAAYQMAIAEEKQAKLAYLTAGIAKARDGYPFFKENKHDTRRKKFGENYEGIIDLLSSPDFETFYKVLPAKDYGSTLPQRQNLDPRALAKTQWFRAQVARSIGH